MFSNTSKRSGRVQVIFISQTVALLINFQVHHGVSGNIYVSLINFPFSLNIISVFVFPRGRNVTHLSVKVTKKKKKLTNKSTASSIVKVNCWGKRSCISSQRRNHWRVGSRSSAGNGVARGTGGGGERRLCGWESLNQDEWFSRPGKRPIPQTQPGVNTADANPAVATRRSRLGCCDGTTANQKTKHPNCGLGHPTAGSRFFFNFLIFFLNSFQCILKSQRIPEPISLLEGGRKYKEEKRWGWVRFKICTIVLFWGCDVIEGESAAGTDSRPTWKQSVFAHWSQHCQCYFFISFIFAPIPNCF